MSEPFYLAKAGVKVVVVERRPSRETPRSLIVMFRQNRSTG